MVARTHEEELRKKGKIKIGNINLMPLGDGKWRVSGKNTSGRFERRRIEAADAMEALRKAEEILKVPPEERVSKHPNLRIPQALSQSVENKVWKEHTRNNDIKTTLEFLDWCEEKGLEYWHELRLDHVEKYNKSMIQANKAYDTRRLYLLPIRRTAAFMAANWPECYSDFCRSFRLKKTKKRKGNPVLLIPKVLEFIGKLIVDKQWKHLAPGVALQGLCGLSVEETFRLTWNKIDFKAGTIEISGDIKNPYRERVIPAPALVMWILRTARNEKRRKPVRQATTDGYTSGVRKALRKYYEVAPIKPKDLRNTLQTTAIDDGWYGYFVQRYVGHAPDGVGYRNYHGDEQERMTDLFKEKVIPNIEAEITAWTSKNPESALASGVRLKVVNE